MIILRENGNFFLQHNNQLYPLAEAIHSYQLIEEDVANRIKAAIEKRSTDATERFGIYVEVFLQEEIENQRALERKIMRDECQNLWPYPNMSKLSVDALEKIATKALSCFECLDISYNVYNRYRTQQQADKQLFRDGYQEQQKLNAVYKNTATSMALALKVKNTDKLLAALKSFHNYVTEAYIYASSFDTITRETAYIETSMNDILEFILSICKDNKMETEAKIIDEKTKSEDKNLNAGTEPLVFSANTNASVSASLSQSTQNTPHSSVVAKPGSQ